MRITKRAGISIIVILMAAYFASFAWSTPYFTSLPFTEMAGEDYRSFDLPDLTRADLCVGACARDPKCMAYTIVRPGIQGPNPRCWLKLRVPPSGGDSCCDSGAKTSRFYLTSKSLRVVWKDSPVEFDLPTGFTEEELVDICMSACAVFPTCEAYNYIKPLLGGNARCQWGSPIGRFTDSQYISGVKARPREEWVSKKWGTLEHSPMRLSISGDGSKVAMNWTGFGVDLVVFEGWWADGSWYSHKGNYPSISLDGSKGAFVDCDLDEDWAAIKETCEIYVLGFEGSLLQVTHNDVRDTRPSISGDGSKIAFESWNSNGADIYVVNSDGSGLTRLTTDTVGGQYPSISADGSKVVFSGPRNELFIANSDGSRLESVPISFPHNPDYTVPDISGDGSKIAFARITGSYAEYYVVNSDGSGLTKIDSGVLVGSPDASGPSISTDGTRVAYPGSTGEPALGSVHVMVADSDGSDKTQVSYHSESLASDVAMSGDGTTIVYREHRNPHSYWQHTSRILELPVPEGTDAYEYATAEIPYKSASARSCKPFAVGTELPGSLNLRVGLPPVSEPVDIYLAIYIPWVDDILTIRSDLTFQPLSAGLVPWKENTTGPIDEILYGEITTSELPPGRYLLMVLMTPSGRVDAYYYWSTSFSLS